MMYKVILIESRLPTHSWVYAYLEDALNQLNRLLTSFDEVSEVSATIIKISPDDRNFSNSELIKNQIL